MTPRSSFTLGRALLPQWLLLAVATALLPFGGRAEAALDPETDKPYELQVVLHIVDHRALTPVFRDQLERQLGDGLQAAYGELVHVSVVHEHPRLKQIEQEGLQSLGSWTDVSPIKTHFVFVDFVSGQYEIQARQHDGLTGQASPVTRRGRTPDREFVARTAALLIGEDFGPVGTITQKLPNETVRVALKGSSLGTPPDSWVKKGDIFELVQIVQAGQQSRASRVPWALLRVEQDPAQGACICQVFHRHPDPIADRAGILGYRCLKLTTMRAPLHMRFVRPGGEPERNLQLHVQRRGFEEDKTAVQATTKADGSFASEEYTPDAFDSVAFVRIPGPQKRDRAHIPVPIVDTGTIVVPVDLQKEASEPFRIRRDLWLKGLYENIQQQNDLFRDLNSMLTQADQRPAALAKAQAGFADTEKVIKNAVQERDSLRADSTVALDFNEGEQRLKELRQGQEDLQKFITNQTNLEKQEAANQTTKELQAKIQRALLLEGDAEFGQAIALYQEAVDGGIKDEKLTKHLDELKARWKIKDANHQHADDFIYRDQKWLTFDLFRLKGQAEEAQRAFRACRDAHDTLRPQKLLKVAVSHAGKVRELAESLRPDERDEDKRKAQEVQGALEELGTLIKNVTEFLKQEQPPP
jgi:hypothetical protein